MTEDARLAAYPNHRGVAQWNYATRARQSHVTQLQSAFRPAGYTLVETLVTLSLLSTLAIASVSIINTLTKDGIESARGRQSRRDIQRLASTLRKDSARTAGLAPGNLDWPVTLTHAASKTIYDWSESEDILSLTETAEQKTVRQERFVLPEGSAPQMTASATRLTLRVNLPNENNSWIIEGNLKDEDVKE
ncbi:MAG TPA: hypothetical protein DEF45_04770 [Rhodopirellula sp.]|nr:hypothetical protein [Rhodopirellula sp.]